MNIEKYNYFFLALPLVLIILLQIGVFYLYNSFIVSYNGLFSSRKIHLIIGWSGDIKKNVLTDLSKDIVGLASEYGNKGILHFGYIGWLVGVEAKINNSRSLILFPDQFFHLWLSNFGKPLWLDYIEKRYGYENTSYLIYLSESENGTEVYRAVLLIPGSVFNQSITVVKTNVDDLKEMFSSTLYGHDNVYLFLPVSAPAKELYQQIMLDVSAVNKENPRPVLYLFMFGFSTYTNSGLVLIDPEAIQSFLSNTSRIISGYGYNPVIIDRVSQKLQSYILSFQTVLIVYTIVFFAFSVPILAYAYQVYRSKWLPSHYNYIRLILSIGCSPKHIKRRALLSTIIVLAVAILSISAMYNTLLRKIAFYEYSSAILPIIATISLTIILYNLFLYKALVDTIKYGATGSSTKIKFVLFTVPLFLLFLLRSYHITGVFGRIFGTAILLNLTLLFILLLVFDNRFFSRLIYRIARVSSNASATFLTTVVFFSILSPVIGAYTLTTGSEELIRYYFPLDKGIDRVVIIPSHMSMGSLAGLEEKLESSKWYLVTELHIQRIEDNELIQVKTEERYGAFITEMTLKMKIPLIIVSDELMDALGYRGYNYLLFVSRYSPYAGELSKLINSRDYVNVSLIPIESPLWEYPMVSIVVERGTVVNNGFPLWILRYSPEGESIESYTVLMDYFSNALVLRDSYFKEKLGANLSSWYIDIVGVVKPRYVSEGGFVVDYKALAKSFAEELICVTPSIIFLLFMPSFLLMLLASYLYYHDINMVIQKKVKLLVSHGVAGRDIVRGELLGNVVGAAIAFSIVVGYMHSVERAVLFPILNTSTLLLITSIALSIFILGVLLSLKTTTRLIKVISGG